ncbi:MAG TPA: glycosyltransferase family A protein [Syntrophorhabdaceae bacterium]|nr:glycosyltransferase family A protein [Syntrophorhabdaceae bacterium]
MRPVTAVCSYTAGPMFLPALRNLAASDLIEEVLVVAREPIPDILPRCTVINTGPFASRETFETILAKTATEYLLFIPRTIPMLAGMATLERFIRAARSTGAGTVYSDFHDDTGKGKTLHPLIDYQPGSVRDDFNFGALALLDASIVRDTLQRYGRTPPLRHGALYDIRLKMSIDHGIHHIAEPLYSVVVHGDTPGADAHFAYVDPRNQALQREMETVFTDHLKRINAYLPPDRLKTMEEPAEPFPVRASVIIPVKNRRKTIADALQSALSQETDFTFNILVVDNHSTDGTTEVIADMAGRNPAIRHIIPRRKDLGIGGCWNAAIMDDACGRYAVQLDSDDLYENHLVLETITDIMRDGRYAMVVGSYTIVNERLEQIPPGLIDHREWTADNGHNNALRVNGLGAPRAFSTTAIRRIGFLNVSYGEDYAAALRMSREYRIGRIYESLYLCRRWQGNTDAGLSLEAANRNDAFKDSLRTAELVERQKLAGESP